MSNELNDVLAATCAPRTQHRHFEVGLKRQPRRMSPRDGRPRRGRPVLREPCFHTGRSQRTPLGSDLAGTEEGGAEARISLEYTFSEKTNVPTTFQQQQ